MLTIYVPVRSLPGTLVATLTALGADFIPARDPRDDIRFFVLEVK